jgi:hypothetical protein
METCRLCLKPSDGPKCTECWFVTKAWVVMSIILILVAAGAM